MYILGLNLSHTATACLLKDGRIVGCVSEERFTRIKNCDGFPSNAVSYLLKLECISMDDIDLIVHAGLYLTPAWNPVTEEAKWYGRPLLICYRFFARIPLLERVIRTAFNYITKHKSRIALSRTLLKRLRVDKKKLLFASHHQCHLYTAFYGFVDETIRHDNLLVLSHDGEGDFLCGLVSKYETDKLTTVTEILAGNSLAAPYLCATVLLGMKPNEHEYKIMGLAPYASPYETGKVLPFFESLIAIDGLTIKSRISIRAAFAYLQEKLRFSRFDGIAGAVQMFVEKRSIEWVSNCIDIVQISNIVLTGGFFMNVKVNKSVSELKKIDSLTVCPSAGDESIAIGACYFGYEKAVENTLKSFSPQIITDLYLGPCFTDDEIELCLGRFRNSVFFSKIVCIPEKVAHLLSIGEIVARFDGRSEWGARSLGNRSILAHPGLIENVRKINESIKERDFWMPFSPTILDYRETDYIVNPKRVDSSYMQMSFSTTDLGKKELVAAIHSYDFSVRPQILKRSQNESYYSLIQSFEKLTGIGAVLNTSFNIHGEPIVCSPDDAVKTFLKSDLHYLQIGSFLVEKA